MYSTVERVIFLTGVDLFADIPGEILGHVAQVASEIDCDPNQVIVRQGDRGDFLYLVTKGSVRVMSGVVEVARLQKGECFGEMSILDSEPRSATVISDGPVELLRLAQDDFYELMCERPEIARSVIRVLSRRLRKSNKRSTLVETIDFCANDLEETVLDSPE